MELTRTLAGIFVVALAVLALWLVALRPKPLEDAPSPVAPIEAIDLARDASSASDAANAARARALATAAGETAPAGGALPGP